MASPIEDIIEEIEEYIDTCKPVAFSSSKISVNRDDIQSLLEELRSKTPEEIRRYQKIISNEKAIISNAEKKAANILAEAQIKTDELVSEHQIMQQAYAQANEVVTIATKKAQELIDKATIEANDLRVRAVSYTDDLLKSVQEILVRSMDSTRTKADAYLNDLQGYLDVVVANRMELSPTPEETIANAPQPRVPVQRQTPQTAAKTTTATQTNTANRTTAAPNAQTANRTTQNAATPAKNTTTASTANTAAEKETGTPAKNDETSSGKGVRNISERFFNNKD